MPSVKNKRLSEFHESYFDHGCTVINKRDVLKTDIRGNSCRAKFKRWWYGLFLVSYEDERATLYYTSSETMRLDRIRQFRYHKGRINPLSKFRSFWDCFMLILMVVNKLLVHHNFSIVHGKVSYYFYFIGPIIEGFLFIDLFINYKTGYIDDEARRIVIEKYEGVMHYWSTKLCLHVASAIPIQSILLLRYGADVDCELCKTNYFIFTLKFLAVFGLIRIYEFSSYLAREWNSFEVTSAFRFLRVFTVGLLTLLYTQEACSMATLMIMINKGEIGSKSAWGQLLYRRYVANTSEHTMFLWSIVRVMNAALRLSFVSSSSIYHIDRLSSLTVSITVCFIYMWGVSEVFRLITRNNYCENKIYKLKLNADSMIRCRQLPDEISKKVNKFYEFEQTQMDVIEQRNILYSTMPEILKRESALACYGRYVRRLPYFAEWPAPVVEELVLMLKRETYLSNDMVAEPWVPSEGLAIVAVGELAVYSGAEERGHLIDGDCFGELSLVTDHERRTSSVFAITASVILLLDKMTFRMFMRDYPDLFKELKETLQNKFTEVLT